MRGFVTPSDHIAGTTLAEDGSGGIVRGSADVALDSSRRCNLVAHGPGAQREGHAVSTHGARRAGERRARQHNALRELGQLALVGAEIASLMDAIAWWVAEVLDGDYSEILELQPDGGTFLLRAGCGWREGIIGHATMSPEAAPQAAYTLMSAAPVVCEDPS